MTFLYRVGFYIKLRNIDSDFASKADRIRTKARNRRRLRIYDAIEAVVCSQLRKIYLREKSYDRQVKARATNRSSVLLNLK